MTELLAPVPALDDQAALERMLAAPAAQFRWIDAGQEGEPPLGDLGGQAAPPGARILSEAEWRLYELIEAVGDGYDPSQPRWPPGTEKGGQWVREGQRFSIGGEVWEVAHVMNGRVYAHRETADLSKVATAEFDPSSKAMGGAKDPSEKGLPAEKNVMGGITDAPAKAIKGGKSGQVTTVDPYVDSKSHDPSIPIPEESTISPEEWKRFGKIDQENYVRIQKKFGKWAPGKAGGHLKASYSKYENNVQELVKSAYHSQYGSSTGYTLSLTSIFQHVKSSLSSDESKLKKLVAQREKAKELQGEHKDAVQWDLYNRTNSPDLATFHKDYESPSYWHGIIDKKPVMSGLSQSFHFRSNFFGDTAVASPLAIRHILMSTYSGKAVSTGFDGEREIATADQLKYTSDRTMVFSSNQIEAGKRKWLETITSQPVGGHVIEQFQRALKGLEDLPIPPQPASLSGFGGEKNKQWVDPPVDVGTQVPTKLDGTALPKGTKVHDLEMETGESLPANQLKLKEGDYIQGMQGARYVIVNDPGDPGGWGFLRYEIGEDGLHNGKAYNFSEGGAKTFFKLDGHYEFPPQVKAEEMTGFQSHMWVNSGSDDNKFMKDFAVGEKFKVHGHPYEVTGPPGNSKVPIKSLETGQTGFINTDYKSPWLVPVAGYDPEASILPEPKKGDIVPIDGKKATVTKVLKDGSIQVNKHPGVVKLAPDDPVFENLYQPDSWELGTKVKLKDLGIGQKYHGGAGNRVRPYEIVAGMGNKYQVRNLETGEESTVSANRSFHELVSKVSQGEEAPTPGEDSPHAPDIGGVHVTPTVDYDEVEGADVEPGVGPNPLTPTSAADVTAGDTVAWVDAEGALHTGYVIESGPGGLELSPFSPHDLDDSYSPESFDEYAKPHKVELSKDADNYMPVDSRAVGQLTLGKLFRGPVDESHVLQVVDAYDAEGETRIEVANLTTGSSGTFKGDMLDIEVSVLVPAVVMPEEPPEAPPAPKGAPAIGKKVTWETEDGTKVGEITGDDMGHGWKIETETDSGFFVVGYDKVSELHPGYTEGKTEFIADLGVGDVYTAASGDGTMLFQVDKIEAALGDNDVSVTVSQVSPPSDHPIPPMTLDKSLPVTKWEFGEPAAGGPEIHDATTHGVNIDPALIDFNPDDYEEAGERPVAELKPGQVFSYNGLTYVVATGYPQEKADQQAAYGQEIGHHWAYATGNGAGLAVPLASDKAQTEMALILKPKEAVPTAKSTTASWAVPYGDYADIGELLGESAGTWQKLYDGGETPNDFTGTMPSSTADVTWWRNVETGKVDWIGSASPVATLPTPAVGAHAVTFPPHHKLLKNNDQATLLQLPVGTYFSHETVPDGAMWRLDGFKSGQALLTYNDGTSVGSDTDFVPNYIKLPAEAPAEGLAQPWMKVELPPTKDFAEFEPGDDAWTLGGKHGVFKHNVTTQKTEFHIDDGAVLQKTESPFYTADPFGATAAEFDPAEWSTTGTAEKVYQLAPGTKYLVPAPSASGTNLYMEKLDDTSARNLETGEINHTADGAYKVFRLQQPGAKEPEAEPSRNIEDYESTGESGPLGDLKVGDYWTVDAENSSLWVVTEVDLESPELGPGIRSRLVAHPAGADPAEYAPLGKQEVFPPTQGTWSYEPKGAVAAVAPPVTPVEAPFNPHNWEPSGFELKISQMAPGHKFLMKDAPYEYLETHSIVSEKTGKPYKAYKLKNLSTGEVKDTPQFALAGKHYATIVGEAPPPLESTGLHASDVAVGDHVLLGTGSGIPGGQEWEKLDGPDEAAIASGQAAGVPDDAQWFRSVQTGKVDWVGAEYGVDPVEAPDVPSGASGNPTPTPTKKRMVKSVQQGGFLKVPKGESSSAAPAGSTVQVLGAVPWSGGQTALHIVSEDGKTATIGPFKPTSKLDVYEPNLVPTKNYAMKLGDYFEGAGGAEKVTHVVEDRHDENSLMKSVDSEGKENIYGSQGVVQAIMAPDFASVEEPPVQTLSAKEFDADGAYVMEGGYDPDGWTTVGPTTIGELEVGKVFKSKKGIDFKKIEGGKVENLVTGKTSKAPGKEQVMELAPKQAKKPAYEDLAPGDHVELGELHTGDQFKSDTGAAFVVAEQAKDVDSPVTIAEVMPGGATGNASVEDGKLKEVVQLKAKSDSTPLSGLPLPEEAVIDSSTLPLASIAGYASKWGSGGKYQHHKIEEMAPGTVFKDKGGNVWKVKQGGAHPVVTNGDENYQAVGSLRGRVVDDPSQATSFKDTSPPLGNVDDFEQAAIAANLTPNVGSVSMTDMSEGDFFESENGKTWQVFAHYAPDEQGKKAMLAHDTETGASKIFPGVYIPPKVGFKEQAASHGPVGAPETSKPVSSFEAGDWVRRPGIDSEPMKIIGPGPDGSVMCQLPNGNQKMLMAHTHVSKVENPGEGGAEPVGGLKPGSYFQVAGETYLLDSNDGFTVDGIEPGGGRYTFEADEEVSPLPDPIFTDQLEAGDVFQLHPGDEEKQLELDTEYGVYENTESGTTIVDLETNEMTMIPPDTFAWKVRKGAYVPSDEDELESEFPGGFGADKEDLVSEFWSGLDPEPPDVMAYHEVLHEYQSLAQQSGTPNGLTHKEGARHDELVSFLNYGGGVKPAMYPKGTALEFYWMTTGNEGTLDGYDENGWAILKLESGLLYRHPPGAWLQEPGQPPPNAGWELPPAQVLEDPFGPSSIGDPTPKESVPVGDIIPTAGQLEPGMFVQAEGDVFEVTGVESVGDQANQVTFRAVSDGQITSVPFGESVALGWKHVENPEGAVPPAQAVPDPAQWWNGPSVNMNDLAEGDAFSAGGAAWRVTKSSGDGITEIELVSVGTKVQGPLAISQAVGLNPVVTKLMKEPVSSPADPDAYTDEETMAFGELEVGDTFHLGVGSVYQVTQKVNSSVTGYKSLETGNAYTAAPGSNDQAVAVTKVIPTDAAVPSAESLAPEVNAPAFPQSAIDVLEPYKSKWGSGGKYKHVPIGNLPAGSVFVDKSGDRWKVVSHATEGTVMYQKEGTVGPTFVTKAGNLVKEPGASPDAPKAAATAHTPAEKALEKLAQEHGSLADIPKGGGPVGFKSKWGSGGAYQHPELSTLTYGQEFRGSGSKTVWKYVASTSPFDIIVVDENGAAHIAPADLRVRVLPS